MFVEIPSQKLRLDQFVDMVHNPSCKTDNLIVRINSVSNTIAMWRRDPI